MKLFTSFVLGFLAALTFCFAQNPPVVVSEYLSTSNQSGVGEWTELFVLDDNLDLRNYLLIDNNSSQQTAQGGVRFRNIAFWQHLRKGTIIVVHHKEDPSITEDLNPIDGYIEIKAVNSTYFETVQLANFNFPWESVALNVASGGDILEILSPLDIHIYSLSHRNPPGSYYGPMSNPKPNYGGNLPDNNSIMLPAASISDYSDNNAASITASPTKGLPNSSQNQTLWRQIREPDNLSGTTISTSANADFTAITLQWSSVPDNYSTDGTTGYIILRNTSDVFIAPTDGVSYSTGSPLGTATVVANITNSATTTYTDNVNSSIVPCNGQVYYRIYAFRYGTDNTGSTDPARGRAYNTATFASGNIRKTFPGEATLSTTGSVTFCPGESITLEAFPAGGYQWYNGLNLLPGATQKTFTATTPGSYYVRVTASNGCTDNSDPVTVTVKTPPTAAINPIVPQCLRNNSFSFSKTGTSGAGTSYLWNFGTDASPATSTAEAPTGIVYSSAGVKTITLTVTFDGCVTTATQTLRINADPVITIASVVAICAGDSVRLQAIVSGADTYSWSGAGLSANNIPAPWAKPASTTTYILTASNSGTGCTSQQSVTVNVNPKPSVRIQADGPTTLCAGGTVTLSDDATSGGGQYTWLPGFESGPVLKITATTPGTTLYKVVLTNGNGCRDTSNTIAITVTGKPDAFIIAQGSTTVCKGGKVTLSANDIQGASYKWSNGNTGREISVGKGTYRVTVSLGTGCDSISLPVTVTELAPSYTISDKAVIFNELGKCESTTEKTVTVTNTSNEELTITSSSSPDFVGPATFVLRAHDSKTVTVRFAPAGGAGTYNGIIYLTALPCTILDSITVTGTKAGTNDVTLALASVTFPLRLSCDTDIQDTVVTIRNTGTQTVRITSTSMTAPFELVSPAAGDFPVSIPPASAADFTFRFNPAASGIANADAVIRYENGDCRDSLRLSLSGNFQTPALAVHDGISAFGFASLLGCEDSRDSVIVITNTGSMPITLSASFDPTGEFSVLSHSSLTVAPGERDTIRVRFSPSAIGLRQSTLTVGELLCGATISIPFNGTKQGVSFVATEKVQFDPVIMPCSPSGSTTAVITIGNTSGEQTDGSIQTASLLHNDAAFQISIPPGTILENGKPLQFTVTFTPPADGIFTDTLLIQLQPCNIIKSIPLTGTRTQSSMNKTSEEINLTPQIIGNSINASVIFRNTGSTPVKVETIGGITAPFSLLDVQPPIPAIIEPGGSITATVKYLANDAEADTIHVFALLSSPCMLQTDSTQISSNGIEQSGPLPITITASLPTLTGRPGDEITIPVALASSSIDTARISAVQATMSYNGALLLPLSANSGDIASGFTINAQETRPGHLNITLNGGSSMLSGSGTLATVRFRVLLGNTLTTPLLLDTLTFDAPVGVVYTKAGGLFTLTDSCDIATRLMDISGKTGVTVTGSDDSEVQLEITTAYDGHTALDLYDALGRNISTLFSGYLAAGKRNINVPTDKLPGGVYFLILQTGSTVKTVQLPLLK